MPLNPEIAMIHFFRNSHFLLHFIPPLLYRYVNREVVAPPTDPPYKLACELKKSGRLNLSSLESTLMAVPTRAQRKEMNRQRYGTGTVAMDYGS